MSKNNVLKFAGVISAVILIAAAAYGAYLWFFCRVYVPAGMMAVVTAKTGRQPAPGTILVNEGEKVSAKRCFQREDTFLTRCCMISNSVTI